MKRILIVLAVVAFGAACFAAGEAAKKMKFPYAGEKLNEPCGKTELEYRCAAAGIRVDKPIRLTREFDLAELAAEPKPKGLLVAARIELRPGQRISPKHPDWKGRLWEATAKVYDEARTRFGDGIGEDKPFAHVDNMEIRVYAGNKLIARRSGGTFEVIVD